MTTNNQDLAWEGRREFSEWLIWRSFYKVHFRLRSSDRILTHNHNQSASAPTITFHTRFPLSRCRPQVSLALPQIIVVILVHRFASSLVTMSES